MQILDNINQTVRSDLQATIKKGSKLSIAAACFSIYAYQELKKQVTSAVISPTPRTVSKCCGISLMIEEKDVEAVEKCASDHGIEILQIAAVEKDLNPRRDRYC